VTATGSVHTVSTADLECLKEDFMTPLDIAKAMKFPSLYSILNPVFNVSASDKNLQSLQSQFHELICNEMGWDGDEVNLPELSVLKENNGVGWFPVNPGVDQEVNIRHRGLDWY